MVWRFTVFFLLLAWGSVSHAHTVEIELSGEYARANYVSGPLGGKAGRLEYDAGLIYNENNDYLLNGSLMVRAENLDVPLLIAAGGRLYLGEVTDKDVGALALGGDLIYAPAVLAGFEFGGRLFFAPKVTSFADAEQVLDYSIWAGYQISSLATIYIGYQSLETKLKQLGDQKVADSAFLGLSFHF
ncbi:MAG: hypothetical protein JSW10_06640 [Pseudomonadota bacterium]|nr:MAG: hypothetical protein JSW10_06640 [Pseudomonadota bacterium]